MIVGVGIDILEVSRIEKDLQEKTGLKNQLFTTREIEYCESKRYPAPHFAARFCAKEAFFKALGSGYRGGLSWREVETEHDNLGQPHLILSGKAREAAKTLGVDKIFLTLSHTRQLAIANVILESNVKYK